MPRRGDVSNVANQVEGHPAVQTGAKLGYAVSGVLHLLIAWIALQVAWFSSGQSADESGALQTLAGSSLGRVSLWLAVLGFLGLAVWQLVGTLAVRTGDKSSQLADKAKGLAKTVLYVVLALASFSFAKGQAVSSKEHSVDFTATLLEQPGGRILVAIVGLVVMGIGGYHVFKGWTKRFLRDLREHPGKAVTRAGVVGYVANGIALGVVGGLFLAAAMQNTSGKATGMDGALRSLRQQAFGPWLLTAVALGIAAFGIYSLARARFARV